VAGRALVAGAIVAVFWRRYREIHEAPRTGSGDWALAIGGGAAIGALWIALDGVLVFGDSPGPFAPLRPDGSHDLPLLGARLLGFVVFVPLVEELFWRSFLMRWIDRREFLSADPRRSSGMALAVTSILFALEHHAWLPGLAAGLVYGTVYRRTGNLRAAIASHATSNAVLGGWIIANNDWGLW
jgi:CAAX prenyl protease-like protein